MTGPVGHTQVAPRRRRSSSRHLRAVLTGTVSGCCLLLAGCAGAAHTGSGARSAGRSRARAVGSAAAPVHAGSLVIVDGYIPKPASPDVAAAYLRITNNGARPARLISVTSGAAKMVVPMTESDHGTAGSMTDLPNVVIAPHRTFVFRPGHAHLMLENPTRRLRQGDHVRLVLRFARAGRVPITIPVVPITGPQ